MTFDFKDKVVLVTGGSGGIGTECIIHLLKEGVKGILVADINDFDENNSKFLEENGVIYFKTDVTDATEYENAFKEVIKRFGKLDIVINNAGIGREDIWELMLSINVKAIVTGTLLAIKYMRKDRGGNGGIVVNTASILGLMQFQSPLTPIYSATKHFVLGFTQSIGSSFYMNITGVKIMAMCPGATQTEFLAKVKVLPGFDGVCDEFNKFLKLMEPLQSAENVGKELINILKKGENGSIWVINNGNEAYEEKIHHN